MTTPAPLSQFLAEVRELDAKATPGPWEESDLPFCATDGGAPRCYGCYTLEWENKEHDAAFIARARELLPLVAERLEAVKAMIDDCPPRGVLDIRDIRRALEGERD